MMMLNYLALTFGVVVVLKGQVPCDTGKYQCENAYSAVSVNSSAGEFHYCCNEGFSLHLSRSGPRSSRTCVCNRHSYITPCTEGQGACQNATDVTSDGSQCCFNDDYMRTGYGGYCKCVRYISETGGITAN